MIYGKLSEFESLTPGPLSSAVRKSLDWLRNLPDEPAEGRYELDATTGLYAMVMSYETVDPEQSRFESHQKFVDLQYTISGREGIEWAHVSDLKTDGSYADDMDLQFYLPSTPSAMVQNLPGYFSVYCTMDAHRPKIRLGKCASVFKAVVKIPVGSFAK